MHATSTPDPGTSNVLHETSVIVSNTVQAVILTGIITAVLVLLISVQQNGVASIFREPRPEHWSPGETLPVIITAAGLILAAGAGAVRLLG